MVKSLRITYDWLMNVVSVVQIGLETPTLAYTDSNPPRFYDLEEDTQFGKCIGITHLELRIFPKIYICQTTHTVYRCTLENTGYAVLFNIQVNMFLTLQCPKMSKPKKSMSIFGLRLPAKMQHSNIYFQ